MSRVEPVNQHWLIVVTILFLISSCSETSVEQQINTQIVKMQLAISDKSLSNFMNYFAKDFTGNNILTRKGLQQLIFFHFQRNRNIETVKWQTDIKIKKDSAEVEIYLVVSGRNKILPERGRIYTIKSSWKKIENEWLIVTASWKDAIVDG